MSQNNNKYKQLFKHMSIFTNMNPFMNKFLNFTSLFSILTLNFIVFFLFNLTAEPYKLENFFLDFGLNIITINNYENWFSHAFLHGDTVHIGLNMFFLFILWINNSKLVSWIIILIVYFISAAGGAALSVLWITNFESFTNVIGASGAIFGLFAFYMYLIKDYRKFLTEIFFLHIIVLAFNLPIAWYAHFGGAITGTIIAFVIDKFFPSLIRKVY